MKFEDFLAEITKRVEFVNTDHHLEKMKLHSKEYTKAKSAGKHNEANEHGVMYHAHKDAIERAGDVGNHRKD